MVGILVILIMLSSLLAGGNAWGQAPLTINYSTLTVSCGGSQILSASGGCPPYNWVLYGGGALTPSGGDNTNATYVAPASNPNCTNNPTIILIDSCRNSTRLQLAVNCSSGVAGYHVRWEFMGSCNCVWSAEDEKPVYWWDKIYRVVYCGGSEGSYEFWNGNDVTLESTPPTSPTDIIHTHDPTAPPYFYVCASSAGVYCEGSGGVLYFKAHTTLAYDGSYLDTRLPTQKENGCCPIQSENGSPDIEDPTEDPTKEDPTKNAGENTNPNSCSTGIFQGNPVNVATGNKFEKVLDLSISTPGMPLEFKRFCLALFNTSWAMDGHHLVCCSR
jgi:hypothetical protein